MALANVFICDICHIRGVYIILEIHSRFRKMMNDVWLIFALQMIQNVMNFGYTRLAEWRTHTHNSSLFILHADLNQ